MKENNEMNTGNLWNISGVLGKSFLTKNRQKSGRKFLSYWNFLKYEFFVFLSEFQKGKMRFVIREFEEIIVKFIGNFWDNFFAFLKN